MKIADSTQIVITTVFVILIGLLSLSCEEDQMEITEDPENNNPGTFDLVFINDNAGDIILNPYLTWTASVDPDGDDVTYDLLMDPTASLTADGLSVPTTVIASGLTSNAHITTEALLRETEYSWCVIAYDGNGGSRKSTSVFSFTTTDFALPNNPPGKFELIYPAQAETDVPLSPVLTWQAAVDPDGDPVDL